MLLNAKEKMRFVQIECRPGIYMWLVDLHSLPYAPGGYYGIMTS